MIDVRFEGDAHPKAVFLVTDDANAELSQIDQVIDECEIPEGDLFRLWFDDADAASFHDGVQIPPEHVGEWADILESVDPGGLAIAEKFDEQRQQVADQIERS